MKSSLGLATLAASLFFVVSLAEARAPMAGFQAPGFYRIKLGDIEITALSDGTHPFPVDAVLQAPPAGRDANRPLLKDARPAEAAARLAEGHLALPLQGSINAFLVNTGERLVLIDTGAGDLYGTCCGKLVANMRAAGYEPDEVDDVLLTHLHADHVGGLMLSGEPVFTQATIHVSRHDADYWLDPANEAKAPAFLHAMFEGARKVLQPAIDSKRLAPFDDDADVLPGFTPIATPGHTPGHTSFEVAAGNGQSFLAWGDIVHVAPIQLPDPAITVTYDSDAAGAFAERESLFSKAARSGALIGAAHISFPGLGHIDARDGSFVWVPVNYEALPPPSP